MKLQNLTEQNLSNERPTPRRRRDTRAQLVISWALVVGMLVFIFAMSAQTGPQLDEGDGLFSQIKRSLAQQALALTGHEVDVSPIGHFSEYFALGVVLMNALRLHVKGSSEPDDESQSASRLGDENQSGSEQIADAQNTNGTEQSASGIPQNPKRRLANVRIILFERMSLRLPLLAMVLASLYGISDEFHQIFVPQRSCDPADWAVDTIAALIGALICYALVKRTNKG
ncbi:MAG: VanZ family protein [Coriobacteriia bacterium]|nr:VanZ family protein [Coriobacteriia bacterium]